MAVSLNIIILGLVGLSAAQNCGIGSQCKTKTGTQSCTSCPAGTACTQWTTSSGSLGAFYCQYTFCLPESMYCGGRVGTCCSGLDCELTNTNATIRTCNAPLTTTTTTTSTTTTTTTTTATTTTTSTTTTTATITTTTATTTTTTTITTTTTQTTTTTTTTPTTTTSTTPTIIIVTSVTTTNTTNTTSTSAPCLTEGGAKIGLPCVFPFTTKGVTYTSCTTAGGFDKPWCSTATDIFGNHVIGNWGDCNTACSAQQVASTTTTTAAPATCNTIRGADAGKKCVFPFTHKGVVHRACTYAGGFAKPWCSTRVDYWGRHTDGYWGDCDTVNCKVETLWG